MTLEELKYPIGLANIPEQITKKNIENWISDIERFPQELEFLVRELSENQLETPYREDGWTIRQVIHHSYDSHHNSYTRFKWTLTEDKPVIKAYFEEIWAELHDSKSGPILLTIDALKGLHAKWVCWLQTVSEAPADTRIRAARSPFLSQNGALTAGHVPRASPNPRLRNLSQATAFPT